MSSNLSGNVTQGTGITDTLEVVLITETLENVTVTLEEDPGLKKVSDTLKDVLAYTLKKYWQYYKANDILLAWQENQQYNMLWGYSYNYICNQVDRSAKVFF